jgi:UDP-N-acetyl-D-glucosamine dehydrogenase
MSSLAPRVLIPADRLQARVAELAAAERDAVGEGNVAVIVSDSLIDRIGDALNEAGKPVKGAELLILGVAYKADVGEFAESPSIKVMEVLERRGAKVAFHDPFIETVALGGRVLDRTDITHRAVAGADCVALLTPHRAYDLDWVAERARLVFDARNAFGPDRRTNVVRL